MGLKEDFEAAAEEAKTLPESTTNDDKLILYGLFKQANVGDIDTGKPGIFDPKDAWNKLKGKPSEEAMQEYIMKVAQLKEAA